MVMKNIFEFLLNSYINYKNKNYVFDEKYWTYEDVYQSVLKLEKELLEKGIKENDRIMLYIENSVEYVISFFSILKVGATAIPITTLSTNDNIVNIYTECDPALILVSKNLNRKLKSIEEINKDKIYVVDRENEISDIVTINHSFKTGKIAMIIYTSGTISKSKGVMLSHQNLIANTDSILDYLKLDELSSIFVTLPFTYSYGNSVFLTHTKSGGLLYINKSGNFPQVILNALGEGKFNGFSTVGSFLKLLMNQANFDVSYLKSLDYITLAGEQRSKSDILLLHSLLPKLKIYVMYGQTEAGARLTYLNPKDLERKIGSVGKAIRGVDINIINTQGEVVGPNVKGELVAKGANIMQGYWKKPNETADTIKDGWLHTGDVAYKDEEGYIYIVGRMNDIIKYLGHRISPLELEEYINEIDNVKESAVVEVLDQDENIHIVAFVVLNDINQKTLNIKKQLCTVLPKFKVPSVIYRIDELPRTVNGKIKRSELRKLTNMEEIS